MTAVLFALAAAVGWGASDFYAGLLTRGQPLAALMLVSRLTGLALLSVLLAWRTDVHWNGVVLGGLAGMLVAVGLSAFYEALARGPMSIVSPIAACGALVPLALALLTGERPSDLALAGAAIALAGAGLASAGERRGAADGGREVVLLATVAAASFGGFLYLFGRAVHDGSVVSALAAADVGTIALLLVWVVLARPTLRTDARWLPHFALVGLVDTVATILFGIAVQQGLISIVSVIGSLYTVVTILLAHAFLHERISRTQRLGVALAVVGVAIVSSG